MITAITFQIQRNDKYLKPLEGRKIYGENPITDLIDDLDNTSQYLLKLKKLVADLNSNLFATDIKEKIEQYTGPPPYTITQKTKKCRVYHLPHLAIHEEDQD
jgi:hypothetical protein